jgi:hypothetical protein
VTGRLLGSLLSWPISGWLTVSYFPHRSIWVSCPMFFMHMAGWSNGLTVSFPSVHVMQSGFGDCASTSRPSTSYWSYSFCSPVYPICPNWQCHVSQFSVLWVVNIWSPPTVCSHAHAFSVNCRLYKLFQIHGPSATRFPLSVVSINILLWAVNLPWLPNILEK